MNKWVDRRSWWTKWCSTSLQPINLPTAIEIKSGTFSRFSSSWGGSGTCHNVDRISNRWSVWKEYFLDGVTKVINSNPWRRRTMRCPQVDTQLLSNIPKVGGVGDNEVCALGWGWCNLTFGPRRNHFPNEWQMILDDRPKANVSRCLFNLPHVHSSQQDFTDHLLQTPAILHISPRSFAYHPQALQWLYCLIPAALPPTC